MHLYFIRMKDFSLNSIQPLFIQIWCAVAQLTEALRYKSEDRGFYSRWCHNPSGRTLAPGFNQPLIEMSTRNISWGVKAASV
jgi:hypothetical protein